MCNREYSRQIAIYNGVALAALFTTFVAASFRRKLSYERQWKMFIVLGVIMWGVAALMVWLQPSLSNTCSPNSISTYPYLFLLIGCAWLYVAFTIRRRVLMGLHLRYAVVDGGRAVEEQPEIPPPYEEAYGERQPLLADESPAQMRAPRLPPSYGSLPPGPPLEGVSTPQATFEEPPKDELPEYSSSS
eukprot:m.125443 g.125443  ORF g.125443 m.125443 type:complete len:188 (-) comp13541_c0_seq2:261-824(-)